MKIRLERAGRLVFDEWCRHLKACSRYRVNHENQ